MTGVVIEETSYDTDHEAPEAYIANWKVRILNSTGFQELKDLWTEFTSNKRSETTRGHSVLNQDLDDLIALFKTRKAALAPFVCLDHKRVEG